MNDDLLVKHLLGETSAEENAAVATWLEADAANRKQYSDMQLIWEQSRLLARNSEVDENKAWKRFQDKVAEKDAPRIIDIRPKTNWLRVAASLVFLIGMGWMAYYFSGMGRNGMIALESGNETRVDTLSDGSVITLGRHSKLTYPERFAGNTRNVVLDGEAFFSISPDKAKPFIIAANGVDVKVVGTSFNVRSSDAKTEVVVATGVVEVKKHTELVVLHPHEEAVVLKADAKPVKKQSDDLLYNYYHDKEIDFANTPLWRVAEVLSQAYGIDIVIADPALREKPLDSKFMFNEPIESVLKVIDLALNISHEQQGSQYILKQK